MRVWHGFQADNVWYRLSSPIKKCNNIFQRQAKVLQYDVTVISCKKTKQNTFHILVIVLQCSGSRICGNFSGRLRSTFFFSFPTMLVQSYNPLGVPSAFRFSHTLKLTPQLLIASMVFCMFVYFLADGVLFRLYFLSFSIASLRIFFSNLSVKRQKTTPLFSMFKVFSKH